MYLEKRLYITLKLASINHVDYKEILKTQHEPYYNLNTLEFMNQKQTQLKFQVERVIF